jgi:hypothetical protein
MKTQETLQKEVIPTLLQINIFFITQKHRRDKTNKKTLRYVEPNSRNQSRSAPRFFYNSAENVAGSGWLKKTISEMVMKWN